ncbi:MFS transporter [Nocardia sp. NPDC047038]|uniref:MFS transporter n=1 Tax=Nocardia sp. NPDC047038 TaxID=3154338 RepID=UPI003410C4D7
MTPPNPRPSPLLLPVVLAATFMSGFDTNVVNIALPAIRGELHAGPAALELVVSGYIFAYAAGLITGGRLGDLYTYRRLFLIGMAGFTVASMLCGLAQSPVELVGARILQGLTAAAMVPQVLATIMANFDAGDRTRALAWFGVTAGASGVVGQVLGGLLISADVAGWGWRTVFFLNLPVGAVMLAVAVRVLPARTLDRRPGLDPVGLIGITAALALALAPLSFGREQGWPLWTWVCLVAAVPCLLAVLAYERRLAAAGGDPLIDLDFFRRRSTVFGILINVAFMATFTSGIFAVTLLLQEGFGLSALHAGLAFAARGALVVPAPMVGRRVIAAHGQARAIVLGCGIDIVTLIALGVALHGFGGHIWLGWVVIGNALLGFGNMLILPAALGVTVATVEPHQAGSASGVVNTTQQFSGAVGLAVLGTLFFAVAGSEPGRGEYATAVEAVLWVHLVLIVGAAALALRLDRARTPTVVVAQPDSAQSAQAAADR